MLEAIHTATPIVAVPFFVDQPSNAQFLCRSGVAVPLCLLTACKQQMLDVINAIINDTRYVPRRKGSEDMNAMNGNRNGRPEKG